MSGRKPRHPTFLTKNRGLFSATVHKNRGEDGKNLAPAGEVWYNILKFPGFGGSPDMR